MMAPAIAARRYEKGERRFEHVGTGDQPQIVFDDRDPKKGVGKCPATVSLTERETLLNAAIARSNGDRELAFPKKLYAIRDGAIYGAQTSDRGRSYHAYPYRGKLPPSLVRQLARWADREGCREAFDLWVGTHITIHGT
jgi:hypothetical protein